MRDAPLFFSEDSARHLKHNQVVHKAVPDSALVIGSRQALRSLLVSQLRQVGVQHIRQSSHMREALRVMEDHAIDLVISDYDLGRNGETAQALVDDLRRCGLVRISCIVVMVASSGTYQQVAEAAESGIDTYLVRPYSLRTLEDRVKTAQSRRNDMREVYDRLERNDAEGALELCLAMYQARGRSWLYAARIAAEILIKSGRVKQAQEIYQDILKHEALPWARIGVGRTQADSGALPQAIATLDATIKSHPDQTDAYDIMGRVYLEMGEVDKALEVYEAAIQATPMSIPRLQRMGFAALYAGQQDRGIELLRRSMKLGLHSKMFDPHALFVLAMHDLEKEQIKGVDEALDAVDKIIEKRPEEPRLQRVRSLVDVVYHLVHGDFDAARTKLSAVLAASMENEFDFDSAASAISLLACFFARGKGRPDDAGYVELLGMRFSHSKLCSEWLADCAKGAPEFAQTLMQCFSLVFDACQQSLRMAVEKKYIHGVENIVAFAQQYKNIKAIETAEGMVKRYAAHLGNVTHYQGVVAALKVGNNPAERRHFPTNRYLRHPGGISLPLKTA